ncbi:MAG: GAF and ANTAR domain-containing protein [Actinobacteria bacterium]|nr:GAF and ANTAR domain-containing protein [Actinomycetota bacterium]
MHIGDDALEQALGHLTRLELARLELGGALTSLVESIPTLFQADGAGIMLVDEDQVLRYVAATDRVAQILESAQEATGVGPCVESLVENEVVAVSDLETDPRWPTIVPLLAPNGIAAVLGVPIVVAGNPVGSLNAYRREAYHWDDSDVDAIRAFARLTEDLMALAVIADRQDRLVEQLQRALRVRVAIERAVGIIMASESTDAVTAFETLRRLARSTRRRVADIAADVIAKRRLPPP